jgi:hypothetical protein
MLNHQDFRLGDSYSMPQIEFKDLNPTLNPESFLEDLTDETIHIIGGTHAGNIALVSAGVQATIAAALTSAEKYRTFVETTLDSIPLAEISDSTDSFSTTIHDSGHGYYTFYAFSTDTV